MLQASRRVELFERYRVPYTFGRADESSVLEISRADGDGPRLLAIGSSPANAEHYIVDDTALYAALADERTITAILTDSGTGWREELPIFDRNGVRRSAILAGADGSVFLPFQLDAPFVGLLEERYQVGRRGVPAIAARGYYAVRPLLPRNAQLAIRRRFRRVQERSTFPGWPVETALHRLEALVLSLVERVAGEPLPWLAPWPAPYDWALVLTHDVERATGYANVRNVRRLEARHGLRSAWYFVPDRDYRVERTLLEELRAEGCEVGLHGLRHDGRDLAESTFPQRREAMRRYADEWGARGFRGPSTLRNPQLIQQLGLDYDSSWSDVARYEPQPGGCCSWLPFFIGENLLELPITLVQDYTLFELLRQSSEASWIAKASFLRDHGGMALLLTHPDYLNNPARLAAYERFLAAQTADTSTWHALPIEVASWWRRRAGSSIERDQSGWRVVGEATDDALIRIGAPAPPSATRSAALVEAG